MSFFGGDGASRKLRLFYAQNRFLFLSAVLSGGHTIAEAGGRADGRTDMMIGGRTVGTHSGGRDADRRTGCQRAGGRAGARANGQAVLRIVNETRGQTSKLMLIFAPTSIVPRHQMMSSRRANLSFGPVTERVGPACCENARHRHSVRCGAVCSHHARHLTPARQTELQRCLRIEMALLFKSTSVWKHVPRLSPRLD